MLNTFGFSLSLSPLSFLFSFFVRLNYISISIKTYHTKKTKRNETKQKNEKKIKNRSFIYLFTNDSVVFDDNND